MYCRLRGSYIDIQGISNSEARNYAQSHYLCYYMQERDLLKEYYWAFYANRRKDPTGYKTLQRLLGGKDMRQFQEDWEALVLAIPGPPSATDAEICTDD